MLELRLPGGIKTLSLGGKGTQLFREKSCVPFCRLALGDPAWSSGTVQSLTNRAVRLLKHCGVERIVVLAMESLPLLGNQSVE
jgi:hypothetical protein